MVASFYGVRCSKIGGISSLISFFGATIAIVLILAAFVFGAGLVKSFNKTESVVAVYSPKMVEIDNVFNYSKRYSSLMNAKFLIASGKSIDVGLKEAGYDK